MKLYQAALIMDGGMYYMDAIKYQGSYWLVPDWILSPDETLMRPIRIISLAKLPHQVNPKGPAPHVVVEYSIPKSVSAGLIPVGEEDRYEVIENPEIFLPNPDVLN